MAPQTWSCLHAFAVHMSHFYKCNIAGTPGGNFFNFVTTVHLDSRMKYLNLVDKGQSYGNLTKHVFGHNEYAFYFNFAQMSDRTITVRQ